MITKQKWDEVREVLTEAKGIAWDGCHKIYVLMDQHQMDLMASYGYDPLLPVPEDTADEALKIVRSWYEESCGLRFISAVATVEGDPNGGFTDLIGQFEEAE